MCLANRLQCGLFQGYGAVEKMTQLRLWRSSVMNKAPAPKLLFFISVAPALSFLMAPSPAQAYVRFHTLIPQLSWCASS